MQVITIGNERFRCPEALFNPAVRETEIDKRLGDGGRQGGREGDWEADTFALMRWQVLGLEASGIHEMTYNSATSTSGRTCTPTSSSQVKRFYSSAGRP
eukprot:763616-Hanusia_phi.AAC.7